MPDERPEKSISGSSNKPTGYIVTLPDGRCVFDTKTNARAADKIDLSQGKPIVIQKLIEPPLSKKGKTKR